MINWVSFLIFWHTITLATYYLHTKLERSIFMKKKVVVLQNVVADGTASGRRFCDTATFCANALKFFAITSWYSHMLFLRSLGKITYQWNLFNLGTFFRNRENWALRTGHFSALRTGQNVHHSIESIYGIVLGVKPMEFIPNYKKSTQKAIQATYWS